MVLIYATERIFFFFFSSRRKLTLLPPSLIQDNVKVELGNNYYNVMVNGRTISYTTLQSSCYERIQGQAAVTIFHGTIDLIQVVRYVVCFSLGKADNCQHYSIVSTLRCNLILYLFNGYDW